MVTKKQSLCNMIVSSNAFQEAVLKIHHHNKNLWFIDSFLVSLCCFKSLGTQLFSAHLAATMPFEQYFQKLKIPLQLFLKTMSLGPNSRFGAFSCLKFLIYSSYSPHGSPSHLPSTEFLQEYYFKHTFLLVQSNPSENRQVFFCINILNLLQLSLSKSRFGMSSY